MKMLMFLSLLILGVSQAALQPNAPGPDCPVINFAHNVESAGEGLAVLKFRPDIAIDWVDLHIELNGVESNFRMDQLGPMEYQHGPFPLDAVNAGDTLSYFFTTCAQGKDCDSELFEYKPVVVLPDCPPKTPVQTLVDLIPGTMLYRLQVAAQDKGLSIADVHVCILNEQSPDCIIPQFNFRMKQISDKILESRGIADMGMELFPGEKLKYYVTYCLADQSYCCEDTEWTIFDPAPKEEIIVPSEPAGECPATAFSHEVLVKPGTVDNYVFQFKALDKPLAWAEVHVCIDDKCDHPQYNYRMDTVDGGKTWIKNLAQENYYLRPGQLVMYFFTYCTTDGVDCDTQWFTKML